MTEWYVYACCSSMVVMAIVTTYWLYVDPRIKFKRRWSGKPPSEE